MNDEMLQHWYQNRKGLRSAGEHPSPEALVAVVRREGPEATRLALLDHVAQCPDCRQDLDLLRALADAERSAQPAGRMSTWLPLAAAVVLMVGAAVVWRGRAGDGVIRGAGGAAVQLVSPAELVAAGDRPSFVWRRVEDAEGYQFELVGEDGRSVHSARTADTLVSLPSSVTLGAGRYRWWVSATRADGEWQSPARALVVR